MTARTRTRTFTFFVATALAGALVASTGVQAQNAGVKETTKSLQRALARLPYYGVFDYLSFSVERGTVTLLGYAYSDTLKTGAEHAVKRVAGVDEVANRLELLPASLNDDRIRQATFLRIYGDAVLSRYASGGQGAALYGYKGCKRCWVARRRVDRREGGRRRKTRRRALIALSSARPRLLGERNGVVGSP